MCIHEFKIRKKNGKKGRQRRETKTGIINGNRKKEKKEKRNEIV